MIDEGLAKAHFAKWPLKVNHNSVLAHDLEYVVVADDIGHPRDLMDSLAAAPSEQGTVGRALPSAEVAIFDDQGARFRAGARLARNSTKARTALGNGTRPLPIAMMATR